MTKPLPKRLEKELSPGEKGVSSIPNTRPRFGWQDGDTVKYQDAAGNHIDFDTWLNMDAGTVVPAHKHLKPNPFSN